MMIEHTSELQSPSIIIVTHDDGLARMCDRTLLIRDGLIDG